MYRNSSIKNSYDAINYLIDKGYFVIRVGNLSKDKFELKNNNFFDYSFSELISEKLDLFLIKILPFFRTKWVNRNCISVQCTCNGFKYVSIV